MAKAPPSRVIHVRLAKAPPPRVIHVRLAQQLRARAWLARLQYIYVHTYVPPLSLDHPDPCSAKYNRSPLALLVSKNLSIFFKI